MVCGDSKLKLVSRNTQLMILMPRIPTRWELRKLISIANYQFGAPVGSSLFDSKTRITCSRKTGRIRHIYRAGKLVATLRPTDGLFALTLIGAKALLNRDESSNFVMVRNDVSDYIRKGGDVFAKHVVNSSAKLHPAEEVITIDETGSLIGVGSALLSGTDMMYFKRGVAVKVRRGIENSTSVS